MMCLGEAPPTFLGASLTVRWILGRLSVTQSSSISAWRPAHLPGVAPTWDPRAPHCPGLGATYSYLGGGD